MRQPNLCPACGHDYNLDGRYAGFCHYRKDADPALGYSRPVCDEEEPELEFAPLPENCTLLWGKDAIVAFDL